MVPISDRLAAQTVRSSVESSSVESRAPARGREDRMYVCTCRHEVFGVVAPSYAAAWLCVMDRYGVSHPAEIPRPVSMPAEYTQAAPEPAAEASVASRVTLEIPAAQAEELRTASAPTSSRNVVRR